jgi:hypothetical protein
MHPWLTQETKLTALGILINDGPYCLVTQTAGLCHTLDLIQGRGDTKDSYKPLRFQKSQNQLDKQVQGDDSRDHIQYIHGLPSCSRSQATMKP